MVSSSKIIIESFNRTNAVPNLLDYYVKNKFLNLLLSFATVFEYRKHITLPGVFVTLVKVFK